MAILEVSGLCKDFGGQAVFNDVSFSVEPGEKLALVGRNGCGKTSLLRILVGGDDDHKGLVKRQVGTRISYVPQKAPVFFPGETAHGYICRDAIRKREELERLAALLSETGAKDGKAALARYAAAREAYDAEDGDRAEEAAGRLLAKAGLGHRIDVPAEALSGGEKNVLSLIQAIRLMPGLLVLDEPGNHLDVAGLAWLEDYIAGLPCAVLIVSHDRRMLDRVAGGILELEGGMLTRYSGNYSAYRLERLKQAAGQGQDWQADRKRLERLEALVRRFADIARSRPDPAWGKRLRARRSQLERAKAEATERPDLGDRDAKVSFLGEASKADLALRVQGYSKAYCETVILEPTGFSIMNGERVALVGPNGSGKTSLVRDIVERGSWDDTVLRVGPSMRIGYCAQAQEVFDRSRTVEEEFLKILPTRTDAFSHLSKFLFGWADLEKRIADLSGGELNRLQLARASALKANFLVLDEPTNHLDIPTREAVEDALADFEGTVLVVSHDRYFVEKVTERVVFIADRRLVEYEGGFTEYWRDVGKPALSFTSAADQGIEGRGRSTSYAGKESRDKASGGRKADDRGSKAAAGLEARIEEMEREKERLERTAALAFDGRDYRKAKEIAKELERHNSRLAELWRQFTA